MAGAYWDEEVVVEEIPKGELAKYIVSRCKKGGKEYINIREWYCTRTDPTWRPSKAGMTLPPGDVTKHVLNALAEANK